MRYTMYEVASMLGTSHTTVYNKLKKREIRKELKQFISKVGNKQFITVEGVEVLRNNIKFDSKVDIVVDDGERIGQEKNNLGNAEKFDSENINNEAVNVTREIIKHCESRIEFLEKQIQTKDKQIDNLLRLNENNQSLLMQTQRKNDSMEIESSRSNKSIWSRFWK
jgi:hypothetical protein